MNIKELSSVYDVRYLQEDDIPDILKLCEGNPLYYEHCPPYVTEESILNDMQALPPKKTMADKHYLGFWGGDKLVAVMDLIEKYPNDLTAFIGFFMTDHSAQGKGIGSSIINEVCTCLKKDFTHIRLGYVKTNPQSRHFWHKNGFEDTGIESRQELYTVVVLEKIL